MKLTLLQPRFFRRWFCQIRQAQSLGILFLLVACWLVPTSIQAQAQLVKDIFPATPPNGYYEQLVDVNGTLFFVANDGVHGNELWKSDGTEAGTVMVKDIIPGDNGEGSQPYKLTSVGGLLYFTIDDGVHGYELWKSDGTAAGTVMVKDIYPGINNSSDPYELTAVNGTLYFSAYDSLHGSELWKSDGTEAGTVLVKDINPGSQNSSAPESLANINGMVYFSASDGIYSYELWKSDGTAAGTVLVKDIAPGSSEESSYPRSITNVNGVAYFTVDLSTGGNALWKSDGTTAGTVLLGNANLYGTAGTRVGLSSLTSVNGTLYFLASYDDAYSPYLWKSNGTNAGTIALSNLSNNLTNVNGNLYFSATDATHGNEVWKLGSNNLLSLVKDINPGANASSPSHLTDVNGTLYFSADDGVNGNELWKSDGTAAGTVLVKDINSAALSASSDPGALTNVNGTLYFWANDGVRGRELWKTATSSKMAQVITFPLLTARTYGDTLVGLQATSSSGLPIFYSSSNPSVVSVVDNSLKINAAGSVTITAYQFGNATYEAASPVSQMLVVNKAPQSISFAPISPKLANEPPFILQASASSALPIVYSVVSGPATVAGNVVTLTGTGEVKVKATQAGNANYLAASSEQTFIVTATVCSATGSILREMWTQVTGYDVRQIPVNTTAASTRHLTSFEGPSNVANQYGDRIRGYVCPPASGNYTFWIASDDNGALYLSSTDQPDNKQRIAWVNGTTQPREWTKYASQQSAPIYLEAGKKYYIESLHKEANGDDHIAVGWQLPDGTLERPIAGQHLSPVEVATIQAGTLVFDGLDDRATIPAHPAYNVGTGDFTLEAWVTITKSESIGGEGDQIILSNRGNPVSGSFLFMVANQGTQLWFQLAGNVFSRTFSTIQDNGCHHIAITRLAGVVSFYVDGIYQGSRNFPAFFSSTHDIWLGNDANNLDTYTTKGGVDEVRIWNKARTRAELAANRKENVTGQAGLLSYFRLNGEAGQTILDAGSLANHGYLGASLLVDVKDPVRAWESCYTAARQEIAAPERVVSAASQSMTAYPNPFADQTTIRFTAPVSGKASVAVYDLNGSLVKLLFEGELREDEVKEVTLEGASLSSGVYLVKATSSAGVSRLKLVLTK